MDRRSFLRKTGFLSAAGTAASVLPAFKNPPSRVAPSDAVNVAAVGINGMGWSNLRSLLNQPEVTAIALCDVDRNVLQRRASELEQMTGRAPRTFTDYRRLLEDSDVDALVVATPDHWHPLITIDACSAGKHVYVEKPLANSIQECNLMVKAADRFGTVVQVGQWQRSGPHWDSAVELVQSGAIGNVRTVKAWAYQGWMKNIPVLPDEPVPEGVDYDMWLGPARERPFNPNRFHFNFRWFWDYAGGLMTDWGVHIIDMVLYGMNVTAPRSVMSAGGMLAYPGSAMETPDTQQAIYEFDDFTMIWEHAVGISNGPYRRDHGVAFIGNLGTLVVDRGGWEVIPEIEDGVPKMDPVEPQSSSGHDLDNHTRNFIRAITSGSSLTCPPSVARLAAVNAHLGNVAFKVGRKLYWDETAGQFQNDEEANGLLQAHYREPWVLPEI